MLDSKTITIKKKNKVSKKYALRGSVRDPDVTLILKIGNTWGTIASRKYSVDLTTVIDIKHVNIWSVWYQKLKDTFLNLCWFLGVTLLFITGEYYLEEVLDVNTDAYLHDIVVDPYLDMVNIYQDAVDLCKGPVNQTKYGIDITQSRIKDSMNNLDSFDWSFEMNLDIPFIADLHSLNEDIVEIPEKERSSLGIWLDMLNKRGTTQEFKSGILVSDTAPYWKTPVVIDDSGLIIKYLSSIHSSPTLDMALNSPLNWGSKGFIDVDKSSIHLSNPKIDIPKIDIPKIDSNIDKDYIDMLGVYSPFTPSTLVELDKEINATSSYIESIHEMSSSPLQKQVLIDNMLDQSRYLLQQKHNHLKAMLRLAINTPILQRDYDEIVVNQHSLVNDVNIISHKLKQITYRSLNNY